MGEIKRIIKCECCPEDGSRCEYEDVCMCGCPMDSHSIGSGHSPVSMHEYYGEVTIEENTE